MRKITIAIDGYSSCGKSTMAKDLARAIGYVYVDTGAMYRCVTLYALRHGMFGDDGTLDERRLEQSVNNGEVRIGFRLNSATGRPDALLGGEVVEREIRSMEVSGKVSMVAALPFVRTALVEEQRQMGKDKGVVMDGRDIGTTVFPDAEMKVFVTAQPQVRARRRYDELCQKGMAADYAEILRNVEERDYIDTHRQVSPLRKAPDAVVLDNSTMTIAQQKEWLLSLYHTKVDD